MAKVDACGGFTLPMPDPDHPDCNNGTGTQPCTAYNELLILALRALEYADELDQEYVGDMAAECRRAGRMESIILALRNHVGVSCRGN